jgi:hypothetical protein
MNIKKGYGANIKYSKYGTKGVKPTTYAEIKFRSQLEAQWACFFDLCGMKWEYEPKDHHFWNWQPDFSLRVHFRETEYRWFFIEVKPISLIPFPIDTVSKLMYAHPFDHEQEELCSYCHITILGKQPYFDYPNPFVYVTTFEPISKEAKSLLKQNDWLETDPDRYFNSFTTLTNIECKSAEDVFGRSKENNQVQNSQCFGGWYTTHQYNSMRLWCPLVFCEGDFRLCKENWLKAQQFFKKYC